MMRKFIQALPGALPDALIVAGAAALTYAGGLLHPVVGFATAGVLMIAGGVIAETKRAAARNKAAD
jgi:hypothetical protein